jgi:hypothetical protein
MKGPLYILWVSDLDSIFNYFKQGMKIRSVLHALLNPLALILSSYYCLVKNRLSRLFMPYLTVLWVDETLECPVNRTNYETPHNAFLSWFFYYLLAHVYCHVLEWLYTWFELVNRFVDHIQIVSTNNYNTIADFHTTNHSTLRLLSLVSLVVTW